MATVVVCGLALAVVAVATPCPKPFHVCSVLGAKVYCTIKQACGRPAVAPQSLLTVAVCPVYTQVLALGPEAQQQYLHYCRHHMFAGHPTVPTLDDVQRVLLGWYDATARSTAQAAGSSTPAAAEDAGQSQQVHLQGQRQGPSTSPHSDPGDKATGAALINYSLTGYSTLTGTYRLEPQLAAIVLVLAAHSRCSTGVLLDCVRALEKQMVSVEGGVKILERLSGQQ